MTVEVEYDFNVKQRIHDGTQGVSPAKIFRNWLVQTKNKTFSVTPCNPRKFLTCDCRLDHRTQYLMLTKI